jgi:hypothetical protein
MCAWGWMGLTVTWACSSVVLIVVRSKSDSIIFPLNFWSILYFTQLNTALMPQDKKIYENQSWKIGQFLRKQVRLKFKVWKKMLKNRCIKKNCLKNITKIIFFAQLKKYLKQNRWKMKKRKHEGRTFQEFYSVFFIYCS